MESIVGCGRTGKMWRMLQNIYREVRSCVDVSGERTEWVASQVGVRQGCVISPTLFSVFINAMAMEIREMTEGIKWGAKTFNVLLFADDLVLTAEKEEDMTRMLVRAQRTTQIQVQCGKVQDNVQH